MPELKLHYAETTKRHIYRLRAPELVAEHALEEDPAFEFEHAVEDEPEFEFETVALADDTPVAGDAAPPAETSEGSTPAGPQREEDDGGSGA